MLLAQASSHLWHGRHEDVGALLDEALASVEFAPASLAPAERLRRLMRSYRAMAHRHAKFFSVIAIHRTNTPAGVRFLERVLEILRTETGVAMAQCGVASVKELSPAFVRRA